MGAPVNTGLENFEEVILKLPEADRTKLAHWILESVVMEEEPDAEPIASKPELDRKNDSDWPPKNLKVVDNPSGKTPWHEGIPKAKDLSEEERLKVLHELSGAWADHPMTAEELIENIYSSRTISTREINLDD